MIFDFWMSCPRGSTKVCIYQFSTFGCLARRGPPKLAFINFRPLDVLPARVHQSSYSSIFDLWMSYPQRSATARIHQFSTFGCPARMGPPKLAFINFRPLDVLAARVHQSSHLSFFDLWMSCPRGSTKARIHQFSTFGCLTHKGPPKLAFINFRPLDVLPARIHQSSHSLIFDLWMSYLQGSTKARIYH